MRRVLLLIAVVLALAGLGTLPGNGLLGAIMLVVGAVVLAASIRRKDERALRAVGNVEPICPHCSQRLDKKPGRKKKCPHCGEFMYVRTRPSDEQRVLVTGAEAEEIEEQWSIVNGTHEEYLAQRKRFAGEKARLAGRSGREPGESDIRWSLLNQELVQHASQQDWGLFRNARFEMAEILRRESKLQDALGTYLEVCYLDLNGPNNMGGVSDAQLIKQFPPWNPKQHGFLAPGVLGRLARIIQKTDVDQSAVEDLFLSRATQSKNSLRLPVSVRKAWTKIEEGLYSD